MHLEHLADRSSRGGRWCILEAWGNADPDEDLRRRRHNRQNKTTYLATGTALHVEGADDPTAVGVLPEVEQSPVLRPGDTLDVVRDCSPVPTDLTEKRIGCTLGEVFDHARVGESIFFDDGRIGGEIAAVGPDALRVRISRAAATGSKLNKGPHIEEAVVVLNDILCRMAEHHYKKNALLRQLHSWRAAPEA